MGQHNSTDPQATGPANPGRLSLSIPAKWHLRVFRDAQAAGVSVSREVMALMQEGWAARAKRVQEAPPE